MHIKPCLLAVFCCFCQCCRHIQPLWVGSKQLCLFDWLDPSWGLSKTWRISTKDVSRDCPLSRGGFWRSRASSLEPEKARKVIRISFSQRQQQRFQCLHSSFTPITYMPFMFSSIDSKWASMTKSYKKLNSTEMLQVKDDCLPSSASLPQDSSQKADD